MTSDLELSAVENLSIFAKLYGIPREKRKQTIQQLLQEVDLDTMGGQAGENVFRRHAAADGNRARPRP